MIKRYEEDKRGGNDYLDFCEVVKIELYTQ